MINELLDKALKEKPDLIYKDIGCDYFRYGFGIHKNMKTKEYEIGFNYEGSIVTYKTLTSHQKEMVVKIFKKWSLDNENRIINRFL